MKDYLTSLLHNAIASIGIDATLVAIDFETPKQEQFGDIATNVAFTLARSTKEPPRVIAEKLRQALTTDNGYIQKIEVAGAGFINFTFTPKYFQERFNEALSNKNFGRTEVQQKIKTLVEFVSVNPTGPLHLGHGRQTVLGDVLCNILEWTGNDVTREYYFNNAGKQIDLLGQSVLARYRGLIGQEENFPGDGYQGAYIKDISSNLLRSHGEKLIEIDLPVIKKFSVDFLFKIIRITLERIGVVFDVYYNESSLFETGKIEKLLGELKEKDLVYEKEGALFMKFSELGLEDDRVIVKSTGEPTYRLPDIAYHITKFERGFENIIDIFGADHIATIPDVKAAVGALGYNVSRIHVLIHQFVTFIKNGEQVKMSKRNADMMTLDDLINEVGRDAVRFFFINRTANAHLQFDFDLAKEQSEKNPMFYLQYAHARIASVRRMAEEAGIKMKKAPDVELLSSKPEIDLIKTLLRFPETLAYAARELEPYHVIEYLRSVAADYHKFYHECRIIGESPDLSRARLALCELSQRVLASGCAIIGISAPSRM